MKNRKLINIFTVFISIYPLLFVYATPIHSVSIADFLLIIFIFIFYILMLKNKNTIQISTPGVIAFFMTSIVLYFLHLEYFVILLQ